MVPEKCSGESISVTTVQICCELPLFEFLHIEHLCFLEYQTVFKFCNSVLRDDLLWNIRASHVIQGINNALELPHTPPPKPLLWKFAGHPLLAQTQEDSEAVNRLYAICDDLHCGEHGLHLDPRSRPAVFSLIGSSADAKNNETEALQHPQFGMLPDQNGEMAIASLVCDPGLRRYIF